MECQNRSPPQGWTMLLHGNDSEADSGQQLGVLRYGDCLATIVRGAGRDSRGAREAPAVHSGRSPPDSLRPNLARTQRTAFGGARGNDSGASGHNRSEARLPPFRAGDTPPVRPLSWLQPLRVLIGLRPNSLPVPASVLLDAEPGWTDGCLSWHIASKSRPVECSRRGGRA